MISGQLILVYRPGITATAIVNWSLRILYYFCIDLYRFHIGFHIVYAYLSRCCIDFYRLYIYIYIYIYVRAFKPVYTEYGFIGSVCVCYVSYMCVLICFI